MADFDVIVVGSGMSGGWVAKEMAEKGFKVAVIERGRDIEPTKDYTDSVDPWDTPNLDWTPEADRKLRPWPSGQVWKLKLHGRYPRRLDLRRIRATAERAALSRWA